MCGIFGAIESNLTEQKLHAAEAALAHRGPDASGIFMDPTRDIGLVHRRLSVVDIDGGDQPLVHRNRDIILVCNGEIYDFERTRSQLQSEGYAFATNSDCEVIVNLYLMYGTGFLSRLRGEFAFLLLDRREGRLIAARDRFGLKPLYFAQTDSGGWCIASEVKAMSAAGLKQLEMAPEKYSRNENCSLFEGVYVVSPATAVIFDVRSRNFDTLTYWKPEFPVESASVADTTRQQWLEALDHSLAEAVRLRMRADVSVGCYLSGGIDSAVVLAMAARLGAKNMKAFTVSFIDMPGRFNEEDKARRIAEHLGVDHHVLKLDTETLWDNLENCLWHNEAPIVNFAPVAKYLLSRFTSNHVKVVLTGEGADEIFLGYDVFHRMLDEKPGCDGARRVPPSIRMRLQAKFRKMLRRCIGDWMQKKTHSGNIIDDSVLAALPRQSEDGSQLRGRVPLVKRQYRMLKNQLHRTILCAYGDRMEMAHSVEGRVPFLDSVLFDVVKNIPVKYKIDGEHCKIILRDIAANLLPEEVVNRPKWKFSTPSPAFDPGRYESLDRLVKQYLSRSAIRRSGLFNWTGVALLRALRRFGGRGGQVDRALFQILCLQILHQQFVQSKVLSAESCLQSPG